MENSRVAKLVSPEQMQILNQVIPKVSAAGKDEVLVRVEYVGICGSDVHFFKQQGGLKYPLELGHECAGTVAAVGEQVSNIKVGDRVALEPGKECGTCEHCAGGKYNLCTNMDFMASPPSFHGALCDYIKHPAHRCFVLPENVSTLQGCLMEPMAVGFYAAQRGRVASGEKVLIIGAGCIGLMAMLGCLNAGASEVIVTDIVNNRLEMAKNLGATKTILSDNAHWEGLDMDVIIECSGSPTAMEIVSAAMKAGGRMVMVGCPLSPVPVEFAPLCIKEIEILPVYRYRNMFPILIDILKDEKINIQPIVSRIYAFDDVQNAFYDALHNKDQVLKNVICLSN